MHEVSCANVDKSMRIATINLCTEFVGETDNKEGEALKFKNLVAKEYAGRRELMVTTSSIINGETDEDVDHTLNGLELW